ncbi:hypothetical protein B0H14DRAFT_3655974 [Mycena olivaceomarginata]|nr:hypothetical protein B0H14DRAFT_3655974 [Mycena olivaceomarginata]
MSTKQVKRKEKKRVPRGERKNLRLWAEGICEQILEPHLEEYSKALDKGWVQEREYLMRVCNEFHARINWRTPDHEEPVLRPFDPSTLIIPEQLSDEEEAERAHSAMLSGVKPPPKARQAFQQYMAESYADEIAPKVETQWAAAVERGDPETAKTKTPKAGFKSRVARELFAKLPADEKAAFSQRAKEHAAEAKEEYLRALRDPPPNNPADRQKCINAIPDFMAPILRGLEEHTGLHAVLIMGGPMPSVSNGVNRTAAADHWPQWNKDRFNKQVLAFMVEYLHTAFTPADCAAAALPAKGDLDHAKYTIREPEIDSGDSDEDSNDSDSSSDPDDESPAKKKHKAASSEPGPSGKRKRTNLPPIPNATPAAAKSSTPKPTTTTVTMGEITVTFEDPTAGTPYEQLTLQQQVDRNRLRNQALGAMWRSDINIPGHTADRPSPRPRQLKKKVVLSEPNRRSTRLTANNENDTMDMASESPAPTPNSTRPPTPATDDDMGDGLRGVTRRVGLGLPQSYEVGLSPIGVGLSPMGIGLAAVVDRVDERRFW